MKKVVSILVVLAFATAAHAAVSATAAQTNAPTVGLAGYTTYTVSVTTSVGTEGFDIFLDDMASGAGTQGAAVPGALSQQVIPLPNFPTVYQDNNVLMPGFALNPAHDTQVMFLLATVTTLVNDTNLNDESTGFLKASFSWTTPQGTVTPVAQVVLANGLGLYCQGNALLNDGGTYKLAPYSIFLPEPASLALLGIGGLGVLLRRKR